MKIQNRSDKSLAWALLALAAITPAASAQGKGEEYFETGIAANSAMGAAALATARATTRDVGDRLFRMRAGIRPIEETVQSGAAPAGDAKGGMSTSPVMTTTTRLRCWEVYGSLYYYTENQDTYAVRANVPGALRGLLLIHPGTDVDIFGGNVGIERHFNENWSAGLAVGASSTDVDMTFVGSSDIDTLSVTPYLSYYRADALGAADFWADVMYSHGFHEYDVARLTVPGFATGSPDADTDLLELTTGLNLQAGNVTHGPFGGLRWIDGTIDSYTEVGPGGGFFPEQDIESLASILGYQASFPIKLSGGTLVPQVRGAWEHEFEDDANSLFGFSLGERDEDIAVLGAGIGYYCNSGWNAVLDYEARLSSNIDGYFVSLKIGKEF